MSSVSRSVGRPVSRSVLVGQLNNLASIIKSIFATGEQGFAYDPNDLTTLYQDAAGTVPVTAVGQPVGLMLDKSGRNNHAFQTVSASRPILQQTPILGNELLPEVGSFDAGGVGWLAPNGGWTYTAGAAVSTGGLTGSRYIMPAPAVTSVGKTYTISMVIRSKGTKGTMGVSFNDGSSFTKRWELKDIVNGGVSSQSGTISQNQQLYIWTADGWDGSIESVSIKEVLGYHEGQNYLAFDGADDFLQTNNIDFTATDKVSLFAGLNVVAGAATGCVIEISTSATVNNGSFGLFKGPSAIQWASRGTIGGLGAQYALPIYPDVLCAKAAINTPLLTVRRNAILNIDDNRTQGTGNYGNYPLYIGRRAGTSLPFNGHLYSLIGIGRLTTDSETITLEKYIAKNTGVTLNV